MESEPPRGRYSPYIRSSCCSARHYPHAQKQKRNYAELGVTAVPDPEDLVYPFRQVHPVQ